MNWSDLKGIIGTAAPILGGLVGGPAGAIVGKLVATGLGLSPDATPDAVAGLLATNPDAYVKLQQIENDNKVQLQQLMVTSEQNRLQAANAALAAETADRASARDLAGKQPADYTRQILTYMMTLLMIWLVYEIFSGGASAVLKDPITSLTAGTLLGLVFREIGSVFAFWFGTNNEGQKQTRAITAFATAPGTVTAADPTTTTVTTPPAVNVDSTPASDIFKGH